MIAPRLERVFAAEMTSQEIDDVASTLWFILSWRAIDADREERAAGSCNSPAAVAAERRPEKTPTQSPTDLTPPAVIGGA